MRKTILMSILLLIVTVDSLAQNTHKITIEFYGMKSDKGDLYIALYNTKESFLKKAVKGNIAKITNKKAIVAFEEIEEGEYAISCFHDENDNKKMDTRIFGIPKEPIGISNDAKGFMGAPRYKDAKFIVNKDVKLKITVK